VDSLRKKIDKFAEILIIGMLALMTLLVTWQVITRFIFASPSTITEALAKYMFLWLVMITASYVVGKREHMRLEFFVNKFSTKMQLICSIFSEVVIFIFLLVVLGYGGGYISLNAMSQTDSALPIPIGIIYLALPICGILSALYSIFNIRDLIKDFHKEGGTK
jgi:TRAP-type transport system small permease protein